MGDNVLQKMSDSDYRKTVLGLIQTAEKEPRLDFLNILEFENTTRIIADNISKYALLMKVMNTKNPGKQSHMLGSDYEKTGLRRDIQIPYEKMFKGTYADTDLKISGLLSAYTQNYLALAYRTCTGDLKLLTRLYDAFMESSLRKTFFAAYIANTQATTNEDAQLNEGLFRLVETLMVFIQFAATGMTHLLLENEEPGAENPKTSTSAHSVKNTNGVRDVVFYFYSQNHGANGKRVSSAYAISATTILSEDHIGTLKRNLPTTSTRPKNFDLYKKSVNDFLPKESERISESNLIKLAKRNTHRPQSQPRVIEMLDGGYKIPQKLRISETNSYKWHANTGILDALIVLFEPLFNHIFAVFPKELVHFRNVQENPLLSKAIVNKLFYASCGYIFALVSYSFDRKDDKRTTDLIFSSFLEIFDVISLRAFVQ